MTLFAFSGIVVYRETNFKYGTFFVGSADWVHGLNTCYSSLLGFSATDWWLDVKNKNFNPLTRKRNKHLFLRFCFVLKSEYLKSRSHSFSPVRNLTRKRKRPRAPSGGHEISFNLVFTRSIYRRPMQERYKIPGTSEKSKKKVDGNSSPDRFGAWDDATIDYETNNTLYILNNDKENLNLFLGSGAKGPWGQRPRISFK